MARYIDVCRIENYLKINADMLFKNEYMIKVFWEKLNSIAKADVVPRSEVERWKNACMHEHNRVCEREQQRFEKLVELVEEAEQEVAKEILNTFASFRALSPSFCKVYNEFEKKYIGEKKYMWAEYKAKKQMGE